jgi:hypothetical protein
MTKQKKADTKKPKAAKTVVKGKAALVKAPAKKEALIEKTADQLIADNLSSLTKAVRMNGENVALLIEKLESIACHIVAIEEILSETVTVTGCDIVKVNRKIRARIATGTDNLGDPSRSIDVAAALVAAFSRSRI